MPSIMTVEELAAKVLEERVVQAIDDVEFEVVIIQVDTLTEAQLARRYLPAPVHAVLSENRATEEEADLDREKGRLWEIISIVLRILLALIPLISALLLGADTVLALLRALADVQR